MNIRSAVKRLLLASWILAMMGTLAWGQDISGALSALFGAIGGVGQSVGEVLGILTGTLTVFDPTISAQTTAQIAEISRIYSQVQTDAAMIKNKQSWRYIVPGLTFPTGTNTFGTSGGWIQAINSGVQAAGGYQMATITPRQSPYGIYNLLSPMGQSDFANHFATVELGDSAAQNAMAVTGAARAVAATQGETLYGLQTDSLSDDPALNTQVGVLNKINAATLIHAQTLQDTNQLLAAMADQQNIALKVQHDGLVDEMNAAAAAQAAIPLNLSMYNGDAAAHSARIP